MLPFAANLRDKQATENKELVCRPPPPVTDTCVGIGTVASTAEPVIDLPAPTRNAAAMPSPSLILSGKARVAGVAGWPVAHSRSPRIHGFWLQRCGTDGAHVPWEIRPEQFALAVRGPSVAGFSGIDVTVSRKRAAYEACHVLTPAARRTGSPTTLDNDRVTEVRRRSGTATSWS